MALRFSCKNVAGVAAGTAFTHSLGDTPDEWAVNLRTATAGQLVYLSAAPSTTTITVATSGTPNIDVFAWRNHSIIQ